jgi:hypothetical protein
MKAATRWRESLGGKALEGEVIMLEDAGEEVWAETVIGVSKLRLKNDTATNYPRLGDVGSRGRLRIVIMVN